MRIGEKEVSFFYSIGAKCKIEALIDEAGSKSMGDFLRARYTERIIDVAVILSEAYAVANGSGDVLTADDVLGLPAHEFAALDEAVAAAISIGEKTEITVEAPKQKKSKSGKSS